MTTAKHTPLYGLIALVLSLTLHTAQATQPAPTYQVELIVFETTALKGWTEEFWPHQVPDINTSHAYPIQPNVSLPQTQPDLQNLDSLPQTNPTKTTLIALPEDKLPSARAPSQPKNRNHAKLLDENKKLLWLLTEEAQKMQPRIGYRILLHQSWIQSALPQNQAQPLYFENQPQTEYASGISGTVRLYQQRYAHVELNFNLDRFIPFKIRPKFAQNEDTQVDLLPDFWIFHLQQSRKIKPGELHYIDHPLFGILVQIKKLKPEQLLTYLPYLQSTSSYHMEKSE